MTLAGPVRIFLADDHEIVRRGLRSLLEAELECTICGEAADGQDALEKVKQLAPDVAVIDISMPKLNGLEVARRIRKESPRTQVVLLSMHESEHMLRKALASGVRAYVLKSDAGWDLIAAVKALRRGKPFFSGAMNAMLVDAYLQGPDEMPSGRPDRLTDREREIVQLLAEGHSNKDIATMLTISVKTAETHRSNILRKLGLRSLTELVRYAIRNEIVHLE